MRLILRLTLAVIVLSSAAACAAMSIGNADRVRLVNDTDVAVGVYLNESWVGTYPAGAMATIALVGHGGPPFAVSVRTADGIRLYEESISAEDIRRAHEEGFGWSGMTSGPCGNIRLTFGDVQPVDDDVPDIEPGPCQ